jgi:hypothetical protein
VCCTCAAGALHTDGLAAYVHVFELLYVSHGRACLLAYEKNLALASLRGQMHPLIYVLPLVRLPTIFSARVVVNRKEEEKYNNSNEESNIRFNTLTSYKDKYYFTIENISAHGKPTRN